MEVENIRKALLYNTNNHLKSSSTPIQAISISPKRIKSRHLRCFPSPAQQKMIQRPTLYSNFEFCQYLLSNMTFNKQDKQKCYHQNYLLTLKSPPETMEHSYSTEAPVKSDFTYIKGEQSHIIRRKIILQKHPEISKLLVADKPYTIIIALTVVTLNLLNCYIAKDLPVWLLVIDAYLLGGLLNHTLHICIHDFTHFSGHSNLFFNKVMAVICNIPIGIPSAIPFGKYHSYHHNFFGEINVDPDLPLKWETELAYKYKGYKFIFYTFIEFFYGFRPIFMSNSTVTLGELVNVIVVFSIDYLIYLSWGPSAILFIVIAGLSSIGPHPAAIHIIAQHYEFIEGMESYDYIGIWNFFNLDVGYHIEHHDFPNAPWYNLRKIRAIAPQFYEYLPHHTSYFQVLKKFLTNPNFNLFFRTIRVPAKSQ